MIGLTKRVDYCLEGHVQRRSYAFPFFASFVKEDQEQKKGERIIKHSKLLNFPFFYGWVVLGLSFLGLFFSLGIRASFGAYVTSWEQEYTVSRTFITLVSMISLFTYGFCQPFTGRMNDKYGARSVLTVSLLLIGCSLILSAFTTDLWQLALLYGVIASIGFSGGSNVTATSLATRWFVRKRGLAIGIVLSGMAMGQLLIVPLSLYFISAHNWRFSMLAFGLVIIIIFVPLIFLLLRSNPSDIGLQAYGSIESDSGLTSPISHVPGTTFENPPAGSVTAIVKEKAFWFVTIPYFVCGFTDMGLMGTHLIPYSEGKGFSISFIAVTFSIIATFNFMGTIVSGYLSDLFHRGKMLAAIYAVRGLTLLVLFQAETPFAFVFFAVLYGATEMASIAPTSSLCAYLFQRYSIGTIFGFVSVSHQMGAAFGSFIPGLLFDITGNYTLILIISIILLLFCAGIVYKVPDRNVKETLPHSLISR